ncbi:hypothetical protein AVEN_260781-1 [Araneus ventricosus]|uniref:Uncharacterized protein n=1 Tax=Araneus ventricosus TaxID=182803 RepID=A0A4Y2X8J3_ARAVE|nr:hypothetical protein AVEN_98691-1 [Araneus ventricosus]GBO45259.1 hypothetical protein AVEN_260781-1 [Araneus ventricosus]
MKVLIALVQRSVLTIRGNTLRFLETVLPKQMSYLEARKLVKSQTPTPGNSYVSVAKKKKKKSFSAPFVQKNPDVSAVPSSKLSDCTAKASPPITNFPIPSSPSVAPVSEEALASPDFTDLNLLQIKKKAGKGFFNYTHVHKLRIIRNHTETEL